MPPRSPQNLPCLNLLEQTPIIIEKILLDVPDSTLTWKPAPDRWSISEILGHLADVEQTNRERTRLMAQQDNPPIVKYDQNAVYATGKYSNGTGREQLHNFCHERDRSLSLLRYLPEGALGRTGQHSTLGRITLSDLLHEWGFHDLGHIRQISEIYRAAAFYPKMGVFKTMYSVKP